ncbi:MAG TPA: HD domain-containing protein, partial [Candidatus Brocadiia bacterium]|nr:HD domain-containing protein [Candidatus Brocadiia bacterium]
AATNGARLRIGSIEFLISIDSNSGGSQAVTVQAEAGEVFERLHIDDTDLMRPAPESQSIEGLRRVQRDLATIYKVGNLINAETSQEQLYERILDAIFEVITPDRGFLLVIPSKDAEMEVVCQRPKALRRGKGLPFSTTVTQECLSRRVSIMRVNAMNDEQYGQARSVIEQSIHSVMCVPVESLETVYGVIYVDRIRNPSAFSRRDLELLAAVGKQAGIAIERTRLVRQVRRMLYSTVRALVASIEAKDEDTKGHSLRVTTYALKISRAIDLPETERQTLELASLLHDVGKIAVEGDILRKPGKLTDEEREGIRQHPVVGGEIVSKVEAAEEIARIVRHHHERWDGSGYPDGLAGEAIPHLARVLAVADAFDAMTSRRPYREEMSLAEVAQELRQGAGRQFDPALVDITLKEIEAGRFHLTPTEVIES